MVIDHSEQAIDHSEQVVHMDYDMVDHNCNL